MRINLTVSIDEELCEKIKKGSAAALHVATGQVMDQLNDGQLSELIQSAVENQT